MSVFGNVVVVTFQSVFYSKMHQNNIFYFLKIIFDIGYLNYMKILKIY